MVSPVSSAGSAMKKCSSRVMKTLASVKSGAVKRSHCSRAGVRLRKAKSRQRPSLEAATDSSQLAVGTMR